MKHYKAIGLVITLVLFIAQLAYAQLGQDSVKPHIFAKGIISTGHEFTVTFTPDGKRAYFTRTFPKLKVGHIMQADFKNGTWQSPTKVSFSDNRWSDLDPVLSPNYFKH